MEFESTKKLQRKNTIEEVNDLLARFQKTTFVFLDRCVEAESVDTRVIINGLTRAKQEGKIEDCSFLRNIFVQIKVCVRKAEHLMTIL